MVVPVYVNQGELRLHLCADTATALTAFIADLTAAFAPPEDEKYIVLDLSLLQ